ncbi:DUF6685 family protein [Pseudomonas putida]|uniref:Uncharacterized protein n=1 Tax=Pseudomonas putida TaxID=303 RepID=A0A8I1JGF8_PSEPU|nr:DUF6685 family protein [Pseudomonas putida]MBI6882772.1 hypothetical protein [Pseudomonas putida]
MLKKAAKKILDTVLEDLGHPATLINLLKVEKSLSRHLSEPVKVIAAGEVVQWQLFGELPFEGHHLGPGHLYGWTYSPGSHRDFGFTTLFREDLASFGTETIVREWSCEIQDVAGFSSSKSDLRLFKTTDAMVEKNSREMIEQISQEKLEENLSWDEISITSSGASDSFAIWDWDGRVFLSNSGGSHHFAAAKYIAKRIGVEIPLFGTLHRYGINQVALASLRRDFDIFVMSWSSLQKMPFHNAMANIKATYYCKNLPYPHQDQAAIFLPKDEAKSAKVAGLLRGAGLQDLGEYLTNLSKR